MSTKQNKRNIKKFRKKISKRGFQKFNPSFENQILKSELLKDEIIKKDKDNMGFGSDTIFSPMKVNNQFGMYKILNKKDVKEKLDWVFENQPFDKFLKFKKGLEEIHGLGNFEDLFGLKYTPNGIENISDEDIYKDLWGKRHQILKSELSKEVKKMKPFKKNVSNNIQPYDKCGCGSGKVYGDCCMFDSSLNETSKLPQWFFDEGGKVYSDIEMELNGNKYINNGELSMLDIINSVPHNFSKNIKSYLRGLRWLINQNNPLSLIYVYPLTKSHFQLN
ncbi:SEC-C domain-containing protein [Flavobacteriaceae bacterium]|nr:SEC-C domain-containing protein [Flavobacteriaceae bacterium]